VVPSGAGVGSAIGFLCAPIAYEVVRSRYLRLSQFDAELANAVIAEMRAEAAAIVEGAAPEAALVETRSAYMRYLGQGHEISVALPLRELAAGDGALLQEAFHAAYTRLYGRTIPRLDVEVLSWTLTLATEQPAPARVPPPSFDGPPPKPVARRPVFDPVLADFVETPVYRRENLTPGALIEGPALIAEDQTTTVVTSRFQAMLNDAGYIVLRRRS
ncbi:MAG: hydantoinase/oxoprolinase family protein, partial [Kiloniellales bacterium]